MKRLIAGILGGISLGILSPGIFLAIGDSTQEGFMNTLVLLGVIGFIAGFILGALFPKLFEIITDILTEF
ncbi:MAG: hypothetical protein AAFY98_05815 [Verrucomicrobiota bacterium]